MADEVKVKVNENKVPIFKKSGSSKFNYTEFLYKICLIIIVAVVGIAVWLIIMVISNSSAMSSVNGGEYQAVFLTNGQAYFGKIKSINSNYLKLTDIYYLQAQQSATAVQPASSSQQSTKLTLVKLGNEIHGPEDEMFIARPQILFWENLKDSGTVVQAILKNQSQ